MHQIVQSCSNRLETYVDSVMRALLQCTENNSESVTYCSRNTLFALCKRVDSKLCLLSLVKYVREVSTETEMNAAVLKMTFRLMMILIPRVSKLDLETWASGTLIGAAHRALNHSSSGMRMAAVLLIVEMSTRLDETFLKSVEATVSPIQMKLIQVYIEKRQQKKVAVVRSTKKTPSTTPRRGGMRI